MAVQRGGGAYQVKVAVVSFAVGNFADAADTPRNVLVRRALQPRRS